MKQIPLSLLLHYLIMRFDCNFLNDKNSSTKHLRPNAFSKNAPVKKKKQNSNFQRKNYCGFSNLPWRTWSSWSIRCETSVNCCGLSCLISTICGAAIFEKWILYRTSLLKRENYSFLSFVNCFSIHTCFFSRSKWRH